MLETNITWKSIFIIRLNDVQNISGNQSDIKKSRVASQVGDQKVEIQGFFLYQSGSVSH